MMEIPEGKVSLLDAVPVRCGHITTEWEGECAVLAYPRFKYEWMRRFLLPKGMSPDIHVRLEEHGTAVWNLIDGHRTVREIKFWTLDKIETRIAGVPDKDNVYFVKMKDKTVAPLMELTEDGIVRSINIPFSGKPAAKTPEAKATESSIDPRSFLTEEILMSNSSAKMAELVAKEIYSIRESKNALLRGEADNMPKDGAQLKLMLDNLNQQETAMTEMFSGKIKKEPKTFTIRLTPKEMKDEVAFRFSRKLGVVANNDLAGEPYYISVTDLKSPDVSATEEGKKTVDGVAYNLPGKAQVTLMYNNKKLFDDQLPITQFGTVEYLAPVLFNKNSTIKVLFDTATGGLIKVDRE